MKRILSLSAALAIAVSFVACQKIQEVSSENTVSIKVVADGIINPENSSKTYLGINSLSRDPEVKWNDGDMISLYEFIDNATEAAQTVKSNGTELTQDRHVAAFNVPLSTDKATGSTYTYEAIYPADAVTTGGSGENKFDRVQIPQAQTAQFIGDDYYNFTANYDPKADVLVGSPVTRQTRPGNSDFLNFSFKRVGTIGELTLKGLTAGETVKSVEISLPEGNKVTGYSKINVKGGEIADPGYSTNSNVKIAVPNSEKATMATVEDVPCTVLFRCLSGTWAEGTEVTVKVETSAAFYTKKATLPKDYEFIEGGLTSFGFNMATAERQEISTDDFSGEWMIVGKYDETLYAMPAYESGNNIKAVEYSLSAEGKATSGEEGKELDNCCYTITKITEGDYSGYYTIQDANNLFLFADGGTTSNNLKGGNTIPTSSAEPYYWEITCRSGVYSIKAKSLGRNTMQFNSNNKLFSCYEGESQKAVSLFPWENVVVDTTPVITVSSKELILNTDGSIQGEEITVSGNKYLTGVITATSSDESWLRASVDGGKLLIVADENTGDERSADIILSSDGAEDVIVKVSQNKAGIKVSIIDFESEVSVYSDWTFDNMTSNDSGSITAHGGDYYGTTGGKSTASITTKSKINPESIVFYVSKQSANTAESSWTVQTSKNGSDWTDVYKKDAKDMNKGVWVEVNVDLTSYSDVYVRVYYSGSTATRNIDDLTLTYTEVKTVPVSSVAVSGTPSKTEYKAGENFETAGLTATATFEDSSTKDVTNEVEWTITPSGALTAGTTSVSVVATYKSVESSEYVVEGLTVTETQALSTIQDIFNAATSTEANAKVKFGNWVVSGVKNSNVYVTDGEKGVIIYQSNHGFVAGDILSGTVDCKLLLYNGSAELKEVSSLTPGLTVTKGGTITPATISIADLSGVNTGAVITFESLQYDGSVFSDGTNTIKPYNTFITLPSFTLGRNYSVTGVYIQYNSTKEIAPRTNDDIEEIAAPKYAVSIAEGITNGNVTVDYPEATAGQTVTITATPSTGYKVKNVSAKKTASGDALTVTNNKFTMPTEAVTVSAEFEESGQGGETKTTKLTSAQIKAGSGSTSYGNCSATDGNGFTYSAYAIKNQHSKATSDYHYWQIKAGTTYYVKLPEFNGNIKTITLTVSNASKPMDGGANTATLYFSSEKATATGTGVVSGSSDSSITIDASSLNLKTGYITASGAIRIWDIEIEYTN